MDAGAEDVRRFLRDFVEEFPKPPAPEEPLPCAPHSSQVSADEVHGEALEMAACLLAARKAPPLLSASLVGAAVSELLESDLSPFRCPQEPGQDVVLLQSDPLQRLLFSKLWELVFSWHQKTPILPQPPTRFLRASIHAIRNTRRKMEDRHVALAQFSQLLGIKDGVQRGYFAVFDGHGGVDAAAYAATHLHVVLSLQEALKSDPVTALKSAFRRTDDMFKLKATRERLRSGSTGVAVLVADDWLHVAWLGDSQVMLVSQGEPVTLMEPHKPEREDEKQRIENLGGCIAFMGCWRVNGTYAVSRAIGDFDQKPYISSDADGTSMHLAGQEDYVLLACDGFFDAVQPSEVPGLVNEALLESQGQGDPVAQRLVAQAKASGSSDNITVMLVFLRDPELLLREAVGRSTPSFPGEEADAPRPQSA
ncbi:protein phosphatase 1F isoform X2 [Scleropages formosus]|uniref:Protein phosphatase 1F n=1 Tax=Scleropages formosus TaxID=113540 RepID=A0A8C9S068_SCLFO|nr:protein phosphatase 1F isoform X2 [Scleropages formosus]